MTKCDGLSAAIYYGFDSPDCSGTPINEYVYPVMMCELGNDDDGNSLSSYSTCQVPLAHASASAAATANPDPPSPMLHTHAPQNAHDAPSHDVNPLTQTGDFVAPRDSAAISTMYPQNDRIPIVIDDCPPDFSDPESVLPEEYDAVSYTVDKCLPHYYDASLSMRYECTDSRIIGHTFNSTDCAAGTEEELYYDDDTRSHPTFPLTDGTQLGCSVATSYDDDEDMTLYREIFAECNQDAATITEGRKTRTKGFDLLQSPLALHAKARAAARRREWRESK